jgi:hypothetical protein
MFKIRRDPDREPRPTIKEAEKIDHMGILQVVRKLRGGEAMVAIVSKLKTPGFNG